MALSMNGRRPRPTVRARELARMPARRRPDDSTRRAAARPCLALPGHAARLAVAAARGAAAGEECRASRRGSDRVLGVGGFRRRGVETVFGAYGCAADGEKATGGSPVEQCAWERRWDS